MRRAGLVDAAFLAVESYRTPMHVGCLQIFSPPRGAGTDFVQSMVRDLRASTTFVEPFSLKLLNWSLKTVAPVWVEDSNLDINHHLQQWALPHPGGQRELGVLISKIHAMELDMQRPPWECHFIEGLEDNRFALYTKMHHALVDGVGGVRMLQAMLSTDPSTCNMPAPWEPHPDEETMQSSEPRHHYHQGVLRLLLNQLSDQAKSLPGLVGAFSGLARSAIGRSRHALISPFSAPKTSLNGRISTERRFATLRLPLKRIQRIAEDAGVTINDVFLELCASGLRHYIREIEILPAKPLIAGLPMSVRPEGSTEPGTQVTFILASLATDIADPRKRLEVIHQSTVAAKNNFKLLRPAAFTEYTLLLMMPYIVQLLSGTSGRSRPIFNVVVSNVPGPAQTLYFNGARMEAMYPLSIVTHGQGLNITMMSYEDHIQVGLIACNKSAPHVQHLAKYMEEALDELEASFEL